MAQTTYGSMEMEPLEQKEAALEAVAPYVAEFVGTFALVFTVGVCCVAGDPTWNATAIATILMVMIYGLGPVSGGHFNPAVSVACGVTGNTPWPKVAGYALVQVAAGLLAGWACWGTFGGAAALGPRMGYGWFHVGVAELFYTALLAFAHLNCATSPRNNPQDDQNHFFGLAIGFVLVAGGYAAGNISGASLNPAITLGLDVTGAGGSNEDGWYWRLAYVGYELLGSGLSALLFHACRFRETSSSFGRASGRCLQVHIVAAHNLTNRDSGVFGDVSDPYVTLRIGTEEHRTSTINNNLSPVWTHQNEFRFNLGGLAPQLDDPGVLSLEVLNDNVLRKEQSLGTLTVDIRGLPVNEWQRRRERLLGGRNGELEFALRLSSIGADSEPTLLSKVASEILGTFTLVLTVGLNLVTKSPATAWSAATALMCMIYSLGNVSGAHFNPAVTVAAVLSRRGVCRTPHGFAYIVVQLLAGVLAGFLVADFHRAGPYSDEFFGLVPGLSSQVPEAQHSWWVIFFAELAFTFMLAFVVLAVATTRPPPSLTRQNFQFALAIGSCVTAGGFAIGSLSGGELNPAVSWGIATASAANHWTSPPASSWINCLWFSSFELAGGVLAAAVFRVTHPGEYKPVP